MKFVYFILKENSIASIRYTCIHKSLFRHTAEEQYQQ